MVLTRELRASWRGGDLRVWDLALPDSSNLISSSVRSPTGGTPFRVLSNKGPTDRGCRCALPPYSLTGVIHRLREGSLQSPPQQTVNNSVETYHFDLFWSGCRTDITPVRSTNFSRPPTASRPLALRICTLNCRRSIRLALYDLQPALLWSPTTYANENRYPS
jgi:hypothetical protein